MHVDVGAGCRGRLMSGGQGLLFVPWDLPCANGWIVVLRCSCRGDGGVLEELCFCAEIASAYTIWFRCSSHVLYSNLAVYQQLVLIPINTCGAWQYHSSSPFVSSMHVSLIDREP